MKHQKNHPYNQGVIYKKTTGTYSVHSNGEVILCSLSSQFHHETGKSFKNERPQRSLTPGTRAVHLPDQVAVGDWVHFIHAEDGMGIITNVTPRRNWLARR